MTQPGTHDIPPSRGKDDSPVQEKKYRRLLMTMLDGFVFVDMEGHILETNESYQQMLGYSAEELAKLTYLDLTPAKWQAFEEEIVKNQIIATGFSQVYEKEYIRKDGQVIPVELRTVLIRNREGKNEGMWAIVRDITERKRAEAQQRENEFWLMESQRIGRLGSYIFDFSTGTYSCSQVLNDIFGIEPDSEKSVDSWVNLVHPDQREEMLEYFTRDVVEKNHLFDREYRIVRVNDGAVRWVWGHGIVTCSADGAPLTMFGVIQDITEQMQIREEMNRSEIEHRHTLDALPEWIFVVDEHQGFAMMNAPFREELARHGLSNRSGKKITSAYPLVTNETIEAVKEVFNTGAIRISEQRIELLQKNIHAEIRILPIFNQTSVEKVVVVIRDRSREKEVEELKQKNAEQKEILLREIHHRVKNNLAIVISLLNFQLRNNADPDLARIIRDIQLRIRSMALIHEHLYRSENLDRIPLASYIHSLGSIILSTFSGHRVNLETHLDEMEVSIETALPVGLIINELLTNALKYAFPEGKKGKIVLELSPAGQDKCLLIVTDNGIGISADISMEPEKSLGLYIVNLLVEQLEGKVEIDRGKGTSFRITFRNIPPSPSGMVTS